MVALRTIGTAISNCGLDDAWVESGIYGPVTTGQILDSKHMKRAVEAHMVTLQAMFQLYLEANINEISEDCIDPFKKIVSAMGKSCKRADRSLKYVNILLKQWN